MSYWVPRKTFNRCKDVGAFFLYMLDVRAYEKHCQQKLDADTIAHDLWSQGLVAAFVKENYKEEAKLIKSYIQETRSYRRLPQKLDQETMNFIANNYETEFRKTLNIVQSERELRIGQDIDEIDHIYDVLSDVKKT